MDPSSDWAGVPPASYLLQHLKAAPLSPREPPLVMLAPTLSYSRGAPELLSASCSSRPVTPEPPPDLALGSWGSHQWHQ